MSCYLRGLRGSADICVLVLLGRLRGRASAGLERLLFGDQPRLIGEGGGLRCWIAWKGEGRYHLSTRHALGVPALDRLAEAVVRLEAVIGIDTAVREAATAARL